MVRWGLFMVGMLLLIPSMVCTPNEKLSDVEVQGRWLYDDHCAECHENSHPELRKQPPNLHGLFLGKQLPSGAPTTEEQLRKTIIEGRGTMPAFDRRLREDEVKQLVAYLHKLK
jgi:mono/diheme cytochrome c family protein